MNNSRRKDITVSVLELKKIKTSLEEVSDNISTIWSEEETSYESRSEASQNSESGLASENAIFDLKTSHKSAEKAVGFIQKAIEQIDDCKEDLKSAREN